MKAFIFFSGIIFYILAATIINPSVLLSQSLSVPPGQFSNFRVSSDPEPVITYEMKNEFGVQSVSDIMIIESGVHTMDTVWSFIAESMGHNPSIVTQNVLDDTSFINSTDVLIISSGVEYIPSNRVDAIRRFITNHKSVYLQCEYLSTYSPDSAFQKLVTQLGGVFSWTGTHTGDLQPMTVLGSLSTTPNVVAPLSYFWYGNAGSGNGTIENYLQKGVNYFGFIFRTQNPNYGILITNSDQDWVQSYTSPSLMQNILYKLVNASVGISTINDIIPEAYLLEQNYPNPFNPSTTINFSLPKSSDVTIKIYDALGKEIETIVDEFKAAGNYSVKYTAASALTSGIYFYAMTASNFTETKKLVLVK